MEASPPYYDWEENIIVMGTSQAFPVSFEVYPPRSPEYGGALREAIDYLARADPEFISVTFGAGGSSARDSLGVLDYIANATDASPLAHMTCVGNTQQEATALIASFVEAGITQFLALRGDLPAGDDAPRGDLPHASDLVALLMKLKGNGSAIDRVAVAASLMDIQNQQLPTRTLTCYWPNKKLVQVWRLPSYFSWLKNMNASLKQRERLG